MKIHIHIFFFLGIREVNDWLGRDIANKWRKPFTSSIPSRSF